MPTRPLASSAVTQHLSVAVTVPTARHLTDQALTVGVDFGFPSQVSTRVIGEAAVVCCSSLALADWMRVRAIPSPGMCKAVEKTGACNDDSAVEPKLNEEPAIPKLTEEPAIPKLLRKLLRAAS